VINKENEVVISMATDENFIYPIIVLITSILENADKDTYYKIYLLISDTVSEKEKEKILFLKNNYNNFNIYFINMESEFNNFYQGIVKSSAGQYRLKLPDVIKENKCIYLDGDTIVFEDLSKLYNIDLKDNLLGLCADLDVMSLRNRLIGVKENIEYFNSGVLLFDLKKCYEEKITQRFFELLELNTQKKRFYFVDQDVINKACEGRIYKLPIKYNFMSHMIYPAIKEIAEKFYSKEEVQEARRNPAIVHYTWFCPWKKRSNFFYNQWWYYAQKSGFLEEIKEKYIPLMRTRTRKKVMELIHGLESKA